VTPGQWDLQKCEENDTTSLDAKTQIYIKNLNIFCVKELNWIYWYGNNMCIEQIFGSWKWSSDRDQKGLVGDECWRSVCVCGSG
jgi:hypothetical protein